MGASLALRFSLFDFQSGDYRGFLSQWYDSFLEHGRWHGLGEPATHLPSYCYPQLYLYLISLSTLLPVPKLYAIKLVSVAADYVAAWYAWQLARRAGFPPTRSLGLLAAVLFLPTVVLNSALWGQCDMMYTCALFASMYYVLEGRTAAALVAFGLSISVKPQAIVWCPFLAGLLASGRLPWRQLWIPPTVYVVCAVPAMLAGQPVLYALGCWGRFAVKPTALVLGAPNWYLFISPDVTAGPYAAGVLMTLLVTAALVWWMWRRGPTAPDLPRWLLSAALLSALFPPFLLPGVHERYFFAADALSVAYAFYDPRRWFVAVLIQFASVFSYYPYLFGREPVPRMVLAAAMVLAIECVAIRVVQLAAIKRTARQGGIP
jgi:Gpi18-like mannosyltransferase